MVSAMLHVSFHNHYVTWCAAPQKSIEQASPGKQMQCSALPERINFNQWISANLPHSDTSDILQPVDYTSSHCDGIGPI